MPTRPPRLCGCGHRVAHGVACPCEREAVRARNARHDRRRPSSSARGYTSKWEAARRRFLRRHPACVMCGARAEVVDHRTPHRGDQSLFWDITNWQCLCGHCHNSTKQRQERRQTMDRTSTLRCGFDLDLAVQESMKQGLSACEGLDFGESIVVARHAAYGH